MTGQPDGPEGTPSGRMWVLDLAALPPVVYARLPAAIRRVDPGEIASLAQAMGAELSVAASRLQTGRRAYAAWVEGQVAAYGWVSFEDEDIGEQQLRLRLLAGEAYVWDCATRPGFQRQGLYSALLSHIVRDLHGDGLVRVWIGADLQNTASHGGIERAGFTPVADLLVGAGADRHSRWLRGLPGVPAGLVAAARWALLGEREAEAASSLSGTGSGAPAAGCGRRASC
ncbi:MAG: GNAT family N-acetyltransferase, partial [Anaerolineales bacterium]